VRCEKPKPPHICCLQPAYAGNHSGVSSFCKERVGGVVKSASGSQAWPMTRCFDGDMQPADRWVGFVNLNRNRSFTGISVARFSCLVELRPKPSSSIRQLALSRQTRMPTIRTKISSRIASYPGLLLRGSGSTSLPTVAFSLAPLALTKLGFCARGRCPPCPLSSACRESNACVMLRCVPSDDTDCGGVLKPSVVRRIRA
jgi:hypothetical protein